MADNLELKACPHGFEARIINIGGPQPYSIYLGPNHKCVNANIGWFADRSQAIAAWNAQVARTPTPPAGDVVERVARAIADAMLGDPTTDADWAELEDHESEGFRKIATAALAAGSGERWLPIESAPSNELILLYWKDWADRECMEAGYAETGERLPNGYSNVSRHGQATHWQPLPAPPAPDPQKAADLTSKDFCATKRHGSYDKDPTPKSGGLS